MLDLRLRTKIPKEELKGKVGKILGPPDYNVLLTGATRVRKPDGRPLCVYLPGVVREAVDAAGVYEVLTGLQAEIPKSSNRGLASGTPRFSSKTSTRSWARRVHSAVVGAVDPQGQQRYCRLTAWTGQNIPAWETLHPVLREIAYHFERRVPERYSVQNGIARRTDPAWVVKGTPFTTLTVNNSYSTGLHTDKGDLEEGFSTIACLRRGDYSGGQLVFAEYRVAVDMRHGDLLLMDAHDWHGNVAITCACGTELNGPCEACGAERISIVAYYRTKVAECGSPEDEYRRGAEYRERTTMKERPN